MKFRYERGALSDLDEIFSYVAKDNPEAASRLATRIEDVAARIAASRYIGQATIPNKLDPSHMPGIDETEQFIPLHIAVLTVSDTRSLDDDKSGATLAERINKAGHAVAARAIVTDDVDKIRTQLKAWIADPAIDVIITTGGTGFTGRDVTPEAVEPLFEKRMDGFSTLFLMVSHGKIGTSAIQTRASAGVAGATYIFCLPGSPGACRDAWDEILVHQLDYRYRPCNFVEIMPRLDEHLRRGKARG